MRKIVVFNNVTLDGYYTGLDGDMSWAHKFDPEWQQFTNENAKGSAVLAFGRKTYDMMAGYWPTPMAMEFPMIWILTRIVRPTTPSGGRGERSPSITRRSLLTLSITPERALTPMVMEFPIR